jgi:predicted nucleic acid-binding protein
MRPVFADTCFYQALLNHQDRWHAAAVEVSSTFRGRMLTSEYVLCELGALMSRGSLRGLFLELVSDLQSAPYVDIVPGSHEHFEAGLDLFSSRPDKGWSLTDCVSFALMKAYGIEEVLTCDHHFKQAGFRVLLTQ